VGLLSTGGAANMLGLLKKRKKENWPELAQADWPSILTKAD
jgi:hypothetical protein